MSFSESLWLVGTDEDINGMDFRVSLGKISILARFLHVTKKSGLSQASWVVPRIQTSFVPFLWEA